MSYTAEMRKTIRNVEATRAARINQKFPAMSLDERAAVLDAFHPEVSAGAANLW